LTKTAIRLYNSAMSFVEKGPNTNMSLPDAYRKHPGHEIVVTEAGGGTRSVSLVAEGKGNGIFDVYRVTPIYESHSTLYQGTYMGFVGMTRERMIYNQPFRSSGAALRTAERILKAKRNNR
jgi:hypothetical protein